MGILFQIRDNSFLFRKTPKIHRGKQPLQIGVQARKANGQVAFLKNSPVLERDQKPIFENLMIFTNLVTAKIQKLTGTNCCERRRIILNVL